jgi:hypothetical protein
MKPATLTRIAALAASLASALAPSGAAAQRMVTNRWVPNYSYPAEPVEGTPYYRLRGSTGHLNNESGRLLFSPVQDGWWSAMWEPEAVDGTYFRLKNRWTGTYLNSQDPNLLLSTAIEPGWWSAMWSMADGGPMIGGGGAAQPQPQPQPQRSPIADYQVVIGTGTDSGAGTDSNIYISIYGANGTTNEVRLNGLANYDVFENGSRNEFILSAQANVGPIQRVTLRSDGSGLGSDWEVAEVTVRNLLTGESFSVMRNGSWLFGGNTGQY